MRTNKRQMSLNEVKSSFRDSGYVDWHLNIRASQSEDPHHEQGMLLSKQRPLK